MKASARLFFGSAGLTWARNLVVGLVLSTVAVFLPTSVPAVAATSGWAVSTTFSTTISTLNGISCYSSTDCEAVGTVVSFSAVIVGTTDGGTTWTQPQVLSGIDSLGGISCPSTTVCEAVGSNSLASAEILGTTDGGTTWTPQTVPPGIDLLEGVSCSSTSVCEAVGFNNSSSAVIVGTGDGGSTWNSPTVLLGINSLSGISCPSVLVCEAVGIDSSNSAVIVGTGDGGTNWSSQIVPSGTHSLGGISCPSTTMCEAMGSDVSGSPAIIGTGDGGTTWSSQTVPSEITTIGGLSCPSTSDCFATAPSTGSTGASILSGTNLNAVTSAPIVNSISPSSGPTSGGTSVIITGSNLGGETAVDFGTTPGTVTADSPTSITVTSPSGTGIVDITVTTSSGASATSSADQFTYVVSSPIVNSISPSSGPTSGGTSVIITGSNLGGETAVDFGTTPGTVTADTSTSITVTSPAESTGPVTGINASLAAGETISGMVTDASGTTGIQGICVVAVPASTGSGTPSQSYGSQTSSGGTYTIGGIASGSYDVMFSNCSNGSLNYEAQWYNGTSSGTSSQANATSVTVGSTPVTGINASLAAGETISGTVTDSSGSTIKGICVMAVSTSSGPGTPGQSYGSQTSSGGTYTIGGIASGSYDVMFSNCSNGSLNYEAQWYNGTSSGTSSQANATSVTVSPTPVINIDASMAAGETISGTVTDASGTTGIQGICVVAVPASTGSGTPGQSYGTQTSSGGTYTIAGVVPGSYDVLFSNCSNGSLNYQTQWYSTSSPGTSSQANATSVTVSLTPVINIDASMAAGETISGTVTDASGTTGIQGICVVAVPASTGSGTPGQSYGTKTSSGGTYTIGGVAPGSYDVEFSSCSNGSLNYQTQWYSSSSPGTSSQSNATSINVTTGTGTVDITVTTSGGTSALSSADQFTYTTVATSSPTVTSISPSSGPATGGTPVTITGTNLSGASVVDFGTTSGTFTVNSPTSITATSPGGSGTVDITVITSAGSNDCYIHSAGAYRARYSDRGGSVSRDCSRRRSEVHYTCAAKVRASNGDRSTASCWP